MLKRRINKALKESLDKTIEENKYLREILKKQIEDSILALNEIQDIQAIKISETEKDMLRNSIINKKRTEFVTKIIELDGSGKQDRKSVV